MSWTRIAVGLNGALSILLVARLVSLRLHHVYRVFCAYLLVEVISYAFIFCERFSALDNFVDYRVVWLLLTPSIWILSIWMVYALVQGILANYPGILRLSRRVLNIVIPLSMLIAALSAGPEYQASGASKTKSSLDFAISLGFIFDRIISTVALLSLLLMLGFILWFPIKLPRNLAWFSVGFVIYFASKTSLLLLRSFWEHENFTVVDLGVSFIQSSCLVYWTMSLNAQGERSPVTLGHSWSAGKQLTLVSDLESMNAVLTRSARH